MIRRLSLLAALAVCGCSSSSAPTSESDASAPPGTPARSDAGGTPSDAGGGGHDAPDASALDDGAAPSVHTYEWSFTVSDPTLNGGNGQVITAAVGDWIAWQNTDDMPHTVTSIDGSPFAFDTGTFAPGATSKAIHFTQAGTFTYYCTLHTIQSMKGVITVK
jgi:plastocyanin